MTPESTVAVVLVRLDPTLISNSKTQGSEKPKFLTTILATDTELFVVFSPTGLNIHTFCCRNINVFENGVLP